MGVLYFYYFATFITYVVLIVIASTLKDNDRGSSSSSSADYRCRLCGEPFTSFAEMQRHELIKHVQEGDFDKQSEK
jgi:hypothetical protein